MGKFLSGSPGSAAYAERGETYINFVKTQIPVQLKNGSFLIEKLIIDIQTIMRQNSVDIRKVKLEMADLVYLIERFLLTTDENVTSYVHLIRLHDLCLVYEPANCEHQLFNQYVSDCQYCTFR